MASLLDGSSSGGDGAARVPFAFPFHPPALALPVSRADYLTRDLSGAQKAMFLGGGVKLLAAAMGLAAGYKMFVNRRAGEASTTTEGSQAPPSASTSAAPQSHLEYDYEPRLSTPARGRRSTLAPETSHIDSVRRKPRQSTRPSPLKEKAEAVAVPPIAPFKLGIVTPRSLSRYGDLLAQGFAEMMQREVAFGIQPSEAVLNRVELLVPSEEETNVTFASRVRAARCDVLLLQYHGASGEEVVAFLDYGLAPRILLMHRPEEILERHAQHVFKQNQYNIVTLLRDVECAVVLGEAARPSLLSQGTGNVCVVPHGFSGLDEALLATRKLTTTVVGAISSWGDMRWLSDLLQLNQVIQQTAAEEAASKKRAPAQVVVYAAGLFVPYLDLHTKETVDSLALLMEQFPEKIAVHSLEAFLAAEASGEITDVQSLKAYLWRVSEQGRRVVVCDGDLFNHPLHSHVFDFSTQLYREHLLKGAPKVEYSGALHRCIEALPIVFECPAMGDVEIEGMNLMVVPYGTGCGEGAGACLASASESTTQQECCPWYTSASQCPDFRPVASQILRYIANPAHYQSHRRATFEAAQQLTMRSVAAQYVEIVRMLMLSSTAS